MRPGSSSPARAVLTTGLAAVATLLLVGVSASYAGVRQTPVKVVGTATNKFDPADIEATADAKGNVTIEFTAEGAPHTIQSDEVKGFNSGNVDAGSSKTVTFAAKPGKYAVYCLYHKAAGMTGTLTVTAGGKGGASGTPSASASASEAPSSAPPASGSASASVGAPQPGVGAPTAEASGDLPPGIAGNATLEQLDTERAAVHGAVSGFRFFTMVALAFVVVLSAAVLFSTRPRRAGR
jgi:plastocyanin